MAYREFKLWQKNNEIDGKAIGNKKTANVAHSISEADVPAATNVHVSANHLDESVTRINQIMKDLLGLYIQIDNHENESKGSNKRQADQVKSDDAVSSDCYSENGSSSGSHKCRNKDSKCGKAEGSDCEQVNSQAVDASQKEEEDHCDSSSRPVLLPVTF